MVGKKRRISETSSDEPPISTENVSDDEPDRVKKKKKSIAPSLRAQLSSLNVPVLKSILRRNHQNPFGNKADLLSRIVQLVKHGGYPACPKCVRGRIKLRLHRRKNQSKYYCPGYPLSFRGPAAFSKCDYVTDECPKKPFHIPAHLHITV